MTLIVKHASLARINRGKKISNMLPGQKTRCLRTLSFGNEVAEEERSTLKEYFVQTLAWEKIQRNEVDVIYGLKGSGKSALFVLTQDHSEVLKKQDGIIQVAAENPRGAPAFTDMQVAPPTSEREFTAIWKLYFASLLGRALQQNNVANEHAERVAKILDDNGLLPLTKSTLGSILKSVRSYAHKIMHPKELEGGVVLEPTTGVPVGFTGKIVFDEPDLAEQKRGDVSVDEIFNEIDNALNQSRHKIWIMLDRLDVAFDESSDLEKNALRALFRAYRDLRKFETISIKIFLRSDIWRRITEDGFREATHMSRDMFIEWDKPALKNLVVRRLLSNQAVLDIYKLNKVQVLSSTESQDNLFNRIFPDQVEIGKKQSTTFDWMLKRTADGTGHVQPRDVIFFLNKLLEKQNKRIEDGEPEPPGDWLFDRLTFKATMPAMSEYKVNRVLFAENPSLRKFVDLLRQTKTEHNIESLATRWSVADDVALSVARKLTEVGFFEERTVEGTVSYWIPFIYRSYLSLVQGKVDEMQVAPDYDDLFWQDNDVVEDQDDDFTDVEICFDDLIEES